MNKFLPVHDFDSLCNLVNNWQQSGELVALCHGCFDPLHVGHVWHFIEARKKANRLVVTVTSDRFVDKGPRRPIFTENERVNMVAAIRVVDAAAINVGPTAVKTLKELHPNFYVKGRDYREHSFNSQKFIQEQKITEEIGIRLLITNSPKLSSTKLLRAMGHTG